MHINSADINSRLLNWWRLSRRWGQRAVAHLNLGLVLGQAEKVILLRALLARPVVGRAVVRLVQVGFVLSNHKRQAGVSAGVISGGSLAGTVPRGGKSGQPSCGAPEDRWLTAGLVGRRLQLATAARKVPLRPLWVVDGGASCKVLFELHVPAAFTQCQDHALIANFAHFATFRRIRNINNKVSTLYSSQSTQ